MKLKSNSYNPNFYITDELVQMKINLHSVYILTRCAEKNHIQQIPLPVKAVDDQDIL